MNLECPPLVYSIVAHKADLVIPYETSTQGFLRSERGYRLNVCRDLIGWFRLLSGSLYIEHVKLATRRDTHRNTIKCQV